MRPCEPSVSCGDGSGGWGAQAAYHPSLPGLGPAPELVSAGKHTPVADWGMEIASSTRVTRICPRDGVYQTIVMFRLVAADVGLRFVARSHPTLPHSTPPPLPALPEAGKGLETADESHRRRSIVLTHRTLFVLLSRTANKISTSSFRWASSDISLSKLFRFAPSYLSTNICTSRIFTRQFHEIYFLLALGGCLLHQSKRNYAPV